MATNITVREAAVIKDDNGPDVVLLTVNLPNPQWPYNGYLTVRFNAAKGTGEKYVREHLNMTPKLI